MGPRNNALMSITRNVSWRTLQARGEAATTVVKLMMACNDLSYANQALGEWRVAQSKTSIPTNSGAGMYFLRMQIGHLFEGLKIIKQIQDDPVITFVNSCDPRTQESFRRIQEFVEHAPGRPEIERLVGQIRHNLTFHYDQSGKMIERAIADRAARPNAEVSSLTRGDTMQAWDLKAANDIVDSIVVRQIWKIPREADLRAEADKTAARVHEILMWFVDFAGDFVWRYCCGE